MARDGARRRSWIDYAIWGVLALILVAGAFLGYSVLAGSKTQRNSAPLTRALSDLNAQVKKNPKNVTLRLRLASALYASDRKDDANQQYQQVLKMSKDQPDALVGLGQIAADREEFSTAEGYFKRAISLLETAEYSGIDNRLEAAYYGMGSLYYEKKDWKNAAIYYRSALRIRRDNSVTHYMLALSYKELGVKDKAKDEFQITLAFDPKMPEANYELGLIMLGTDKAQAAELFRISADNAPKGIDLPSKELEKFGSAEQHVAAYRAALQAGKTAKALEEARIAAALAPKDVETLRLAAQMFEKTGKKASAQKAYEGLLLVAPGDAQAVAALKRLGKND